MKNISTLISNLRSKPLYSEFKLKSDTIKKLLASLLVVFGGYTAVNAQCDHTLTMTDTWGDGWNGFGAATCAVDIEVNGAPVATAVGLNFVAGASQDEMFMASTGDVITLSNWQVGAYDVEVGWEIKDGGGSVLASGVWGDNPTVSANCPSCTPPTALAATGITTTTADLSWTDPVGSAWDIEFGVAGFAATGTPTFASVLNPYNVTGLAAYTSYDYYVRTDCGAAQSSWTGPYSFTTPCATISLPWSEDFENAGTIPTCWSMAGGEDWEFNTTGPNYVGNSGVLSGNTASDLYYAVVDASGTQGPSTLTSPFIDISSLTIPQLSFYEISDNQGNASSQLDVDVWDGAAWNLVGTYNTNTVGWEKKEIDLSALTFTGPAQVRFTFSELLSSDFFDDIAIDDVTFEEQPNCPGPNNLTAAAITVSSAELGWTENGAALSWQVEYDSVGFVQGTGTSAVTGTNPHLLSGLSASYTYGFYVRAICAPGDTSVWAGPFSFSTPCAIYIPQHLETFDTWVPACWDQANAGSPATTVAAVGASGWNSTGFLNNASGAGGVKMNLYNTGDEDWMLSPTFDLSAGGPWELNIEAGVTGYNNTAFEQMGSDDIVQIAVSTDGGAIWTVIHTWDATNQPSETGEFLQLDLSAYTGASNIFGIWATEGSVDDLEDFDFHIGSFEIRVPPLCLEPNALSASNVTTLSADLNWTENGTATSWEVEYDSTGFVQGTGNIVVTATNPHALTGLTANYSYDFYVRAICGVGDSSAWVGPYSFITPCNTAAITYTQDFTTWPLTCWDLTGGSQSWSDNGSGIALANFWGWQNPNDAIMSTEPIDISVDARVKFDWSHLYSATYPLDSLSVDVKVLPGGTWTSIWGKGGSDLESNDGAGNTSPGSMVTETILLDPATYTGQDVQVRFIATSGWGPVLFVDNLIIEPLPTCPGPTLLSAANITTTSADLGWTENGTATTWDIEYGMAPYTATGTPTIAGTITNPNNITMLTSATTYEFYVRADCGGDQSTWVGPYSFSTASDYCAGDHFYDNGGLGGDYLNNSNDTTVICPGTAGDVIEVVFNSFDTEGGYDSLAIYNGNGTSGTNLGTFDGDTIIPGPFVSTDVTGCLTFVFYSDGGVVTPGWDATVTCVPSCALTVDLGADTALCSGQDSLVLDAGAGPYTYQWSTMASTQSITVSDANVGTIDYSVVITDTVSTCTAADTVSVSFGDCSGISELSGSTVSVYPNPSNGNFIISLGNINEQVSVQVVDVQGRVVYSQVEGLKVGKENAISLDNVERGVYLISVSSDQGRYTQSIVIE